MCNKKNGLWLDSRYYHIHITHTHVFSFHYFFFFLVNIFKSWNDYLQMKSISNENCTTKLSNEHNWRVHPITDRMICAFADGKSTCFGDSGGRYTGWPRRYRKYVLQITTFPVQICKITVQICSNFWVTQYI